MLFYDVSIFDYPIRVLPKGIDKSLCKNSRECIKIKESLSFDFSFEYIVKPGYISTPHISESLALFAFLLFARGLPLTDAIIDAPSGPVEIFNTGEGEICAYRPKCKTLFTNKSVECMGAEIKLFVTTALGYKIGAFFTSDLSVISNKAQKALFSLFSTSLDALIAVSRNKTVIEARSVSFPVPLVPCEILYSAIYSLSCFCKGISERREIILDGHRAVLDGSFIYACPRIISLD